MSQTYSDLSPDVQAILKELGWLFGENDTQKNAQAAAAIQNASDNPGTLIADLLNQISDI